LFDLTGQVALVTGSSRGIGLAIARTLAAQGAAVVLHGRTLSAELEVAASGLRESGAEIAVVVGDLSQSDTGKKIVAEAALYKGRLDILVNNAGFVSPVSVTDLTPEVWDSVVNVNLRGAFFTSQAAAKVMRPQGYGRIINISSQAAEVTIPSYLHYGVSKAGLNIMTKYLAVELAPYGITVNTVSPAFIATDLAKEVFAQLPDLYDDQLSRVPKARMGTTDEVAAAVLYLASIEGDFTTGEVLHVDGGYLSL